MGWLKTMSTFGSAWSALNSRQPGVGGICRELLKGPHPLRALSAGQVVYAEVKGLIACEGHGPLDGNRDVAGAGDGPQQLRRLDVVMIGDGDECGALQLVLDLAALQIEGETRSEWRRPPGALIVQFYDCMFCVNAFEPPEKMTDETIAGYDFDNEVQRLSGAVGVAMQRDAGIEGARGIGVLP